MVLWGGTFISGRILAQNHSAFTISFLRFLTASLVLSPVLFFSKKKTPSYTRLQWLKLFFLGLTGVFSYNYFFFGGLKYVEAGKASVIIAINPTITAFLAAIILKELLTPGKILGALTALTGALIVITKGDLHTITSGGVDKGEILLFGAVLSWVSYTLLGKVALKKLRPLETTTFACIIGTILLFPFSLKNGLAQSLETATILDWLNVVYLGAFGTGLGFIWYYGGIQKIGAAKAAAFINLVPIFGVSFGALLLGESIESSLLIGIALVIIGISLVNKKVKAKTVNLEVN